MVPSLIIPPYIQMMASNLSTISDNSSMLLEEPVKNRASRVSTTVGYASPLPKSPSTKLSCQLTTDTFKSISRYYDSGKDNDQVFFDGALEKIGQLTPTRFLQLHGVQEKFRAKMIDWMFEVLNIYQQREATIFKSVFLLDSYYASRVEPEALDELHLLGIVCMMIASKSEEVKYIKLDAFVNTIGRGKFTKERILAKEVEVLRVIGFRTSFPTLHELMCCAFRLVDMREGRAFFERSALLLAKMCLCSYEMLCNFSLTEIALCCIVIALKLSEKIAAFNSNECVKRAISMFGVSDSAIFLKKVQLVHSFVVDFNSVMPYVKNIENFNDFMARGI